MLSQLCFCFEFLLAYLAPEFLPAEKVEFHRFLLHNILQLRIYKEILNEPQLLLLIKFSQELWYNGIDAAERMKDLERGYYHSS